MLIFTRYDRAHFYSYEVAIAVLAPLLATGLGGQYVALFYEIGMSQPKKLYPRL